MAFFDDLGKALSDTGRVVVGKTKDITGALQLKAKVNAEKDKINKSYIELGKAYYEQLKGTDNPRYAAEVRAISEGLLKVEELEKRIKALADENGLDAEDFVEVPAVEGGSHLW